MVLCPSFHGTPSTPAGTQARPERSRSRSSAERSTEPRPTETIERDGHRRRRREGRAPGGAPRLPCRGRACAGNVGHAVSVGEALGDAWRVARLLKRDDRLRRRRALRIGRCQKDEVAVLHRADVLQESGWSSGSWMTSSGGYGDGMMDHDPLRVAGDDRLPSRRLHVGILDVVEDVLRRRPARIRSFGMPSAPLVPRPGRRNCSCCRST